MIGFQTLMRVICVARKISLTNKVTSTFQLYVLMRSNLNKWTIFITARDYKIIAY